MTTRTALLLVALTATLATSCLSTAGTGGGASCGAALCHELADDCLDEGEAPSTCERLRQACLGSELARCSGSGGAAGSRNDAPSSAGGGRWESTGGEAGEWSEPPDPAGGTGGQRHEAACNEPSFLGSECHAFQYVDESDFTACLHDDCCGSFESCMADVTCASWIECQVDCAGDDACVQGCNACLGTRGRPLASSFESCMETCVDGGR
jgi:hypothetical protein